MVQKKKKETRKKPTSIRCGTSKQGGARYLGKKASQIRKALKEALNIPDGAKTYVKGKQVNGGYELKEGDVLEFIKEAGRHG